MRNIFSKRAALVIGTAAVAVAVAGSALAYVNNTGGVSSTGGTGTVTPATGTLNNVTWSAGTVSGLVPGGSSKNVTITLTNPNTTSVNIGAWTFAVSSVSGPSGCLTNSVAELSGTATTTAPFVVPGTDAGSGNNKATFSVPVSMADDGSQDQSSCLAALTVTFSATNAN